MAVINNPLTEMFADVVQLEVASASFSDRITNLEAGGGDPQVGALSASYLNTSASFAANDTKLISASASFSTRITTLEQSGGGSVNTGSLVTSASFNAFTASYVNASSSFAAMSAAYVATSASLATRVTNLANASSSFETRINTLTAASSAFAAQSASYITTSASLASRITTIEQGGATVNTASLVTTSSFNAFTASYVQASSTFAANNVQLLAASASFTARINTVTASLNAFTASYLITSASISTRLTDLEAGGGGGGGGGFPLGSQTPQSVVNNGSASPGIRVSSSREDHTHDHGTLLGNDLHAVANTASNGFMSASDKQTLNNFTASIPFFSAAFVSTSASLIAASSSFGIRLSNLENASASFESRINTQTAASSAFAAVSASYVTTSASFNSRINNLTASVNSVTASFNTFTASYLDTSSSFAAMSAAYVATSASLQNRVTNLTNASSSFESRINTLTAASSAFATVSASYVASSASFQTRLTSLEAGGGSPDLGALSASFLLLSSAYIATSASLAVRTSNLENASSSFELRVNTLTAASSAFATVSSSYVTTSASLAARVSSLETGGFVTTSTFNTFTASYVDASSSFESRINTLTAASSAFASVSSSYITTSASLATRVTNMSTAMAAHSATFVAISTSLVSASSSFGTRITNISTAIAAHSATFTSFSTSMLTTSSSFDLRINNLTASVNTLTASFNTFTASYLVTSASLASRATNLENASSSFESRINTLTAASSAFASVSASYVDTSASFNLRINNITSSIAAHSAAFLTFSSSAITHSASFQNRLTLLETVSSSFVVISASFQGRITTLENAGGGGTPLSSLDPQSVFTMSLPGTSLSASRADHVHFHGYQPGGGLHATATSLSAGFMSAPDKVRIDAIVAATASYADASQMALFSATFINASSAFATVSSSYITTSASFQSRITSLESGGTVNTASFVTTSSFGAFTASINIFSQSVNTFTASYLQASATFATNDAQLLAASSSFESRINTLTAASSAFASVSASYVNTSASFNSRINNITSSIAFHSAAYLDTSASFNLRINNITSSIAFHSSSYVMSSASFASVSASYITTSASFAGRITTLEGAGPGGTPASGTFAVLNFEADQFIQASSSWAVSGAATLEVDSVNPGLLIRAFDQTTEEAVGFWMWPSPVADTMNFYWNARAKTSGFTTNNGVQMRLYFRENGSGSWSNYDFTPWTLSDVDTFQRFSQTEISLATVGLTASRYYQCQLSRVPGDADDTLTRDLCLQSFIITSGKNTLTTIGTNTVANTNLAQMAANTIKGNNTGGTANASDLTATQVTAMLNVFDSSNKGLVPGSGGGTTNFLRADGAWVSPPGGGSGSPNGSENSVQYKSGSNFGGADNVYIENGYLRLSASGAEPSLPASGGINFYAGQYANRILPKIVGPSGIDTALQVGIHGNSVVFISPANATTAPNMVGGSLTTATTISHQQTFASANPWQATRRTRFQTAATSGSTSGMRTAYPQWFRGSVSGFGGFFFRAQFGANLNVSGSTKFIGLCQHSTSLASNASALPHMVGVGYDNTDFLTGSWYFMRNDGTGTATKVDIGAPRNTTMGYDLMIFCPPGNASEIYVKIINIHSGTVLLDTSYNTDLPGQNVGMAFKAEVRNSTVAAADNIEVAKVYIESDY